MRAKQRSVGAGLIVIGAIVLFGAGSASATSGGLFHSATHAKLSLVNGGTHQFHITSHGLAGELGCTSVSYEGTTSAATVSQISLAPGYLGCATTDGGSFIPIDMNGCSYLLTVAAGTTDSTEQTFHIACPAGFPMQFTHPNCRISIPAQTVNTGTTYTTAVNAKTGKDEITMDTSVQLTIMRHGLCQLVLPTNGTGTLRGSLTLQARDAAGNQVDLTAT